MIGNDRVCGACSTESAYISCICNRDIKLLCKSCIADHLADYSQTHDLVNLELGFKMLYNPSVIEEYYLETKLINTIVHSLNTRLSSNKQVQYKLAESRVALKNEIDSLFDSILSRVEEAIQDLHRKSKLASDFKRTLCEEGRCLVRSYEAGGQDMLLGIKFEDMEIPTPEIVNLLREMISIDYLTYGEMSKKRPKLVEESKLQRQEEELAGYTIKIRDLEEKLYLSRNEVSENSIKIRDLEETLSQSRQETIKLNIKLDESQAQIRSYIEQLNASQSLSSELSKRKAEIEALDNTLKGREAQITKLTHQLEEVSKLSKETNKSDSLNPNTGASKIEDSDSLTTPQQRRQHFEKYVGTRYLYSAGCGTNYLHMYDIMTKKSRVVQVRGMNREFHTTSTCELPNGDIFIAGFDNPASKDAYIYKQDIQACVQLPNMPTARNSFWLYFYRGYVYAFGGRNASRRESNKAERFDLERNIWEKLENIPCATGHITCLGIGDKIFLFERQADASCVDVFNTKKLEYQPIDIDYLCDEVPDIRLGVNIGDKVYLIGDDGIHIFTKRMKAIEYSSSNIQNEFSLTNSPVYYKNNLYFHNDYTSCIQKVNLYFVDKGKNELSKHFNPNYNKRYIYKAFGGSKELLRLDIKYKTIENIVISSILNRSFSNTTTYKLPSGEVFIVGFSNPLSGECYLFNPEKDSITKLPDLIIPRYLLSVIYHSNVLYTFGGYIDQNSPTKCAESFDLMRKTWSRLPDMSSARAKASCVGIDNNIYIFGGGVDTIEIFDITTNNFKSSQIRINTLQVVSFLMGDNIYLVNSSGVKILDKDLKNIQDCRAGWGSQYHTSTSENVILHKDSVYFFNYHMGMPEKINISSFKRGILVTNDN